MNSSLQLPGAGPTGAVATVQSASSADIFTLFQQVLLDEARAVLRTAEMLSPEAVTSAIALVEGCTGKLILLGVGKSGLISRKIAATFASVGVTAIFIHAADAVHGDLGLANAGDVAILLSNSGETDELIALLPHLSRRQVPFIAIVGNPASTLAKHANVILTASVEHEACPLDLAPTSSTTVALAIGDALAIALARRRRLTRGDFAVNHPSGRIGKRLTLTVGDLMHAGDANPVISLESGIVEIVSALSQFRLGALNIVDQTGRLLGIVTDGDLRRSLAQIPADQWPTLTSAQIMSAKPSTITADRLAYDALRLMEDRPSQISVLPVVRETGECIGMIRLHDIVKAGL